jgi:hypothetical protein
MDRNFFHAFFRSRAVWVLALVLFCTSSAPAAERLKLVAKWDRFETSFRSKKIYEKPLQECSLGVVFTAPSGESHTVFGFWDGLRVWKVRFSPNEVGRWLYTTVCSDKSNSGLDNQSGYFVCTAATGKNRFSDHGPVRVSPDGFFLMHEDGTPFFWMGDTAWNGALLSSPDDWFYYIDNRVRQNFSAVQFVTTQWRASPEGNISHQVAFTGQEVMQVKPLFFQEMDKKIEALNEAGLLSAPVMLWAIGGGSNPRINPGFSLPEDQAILLARYMVARWGGNDVLWILAGDGDYRGQNSEKWKRIGRAVFGNIEHAPVTLHPGGMQWILDEFKAEPWFNVLGYQSGHGDDDATLNWLINGPPAKTWQPEPHHPFINLEPPYENHIAYQSKTRITADQVRRAIYRSLLVSPTAGVSYGGHGVWGWDDGTTTPTDHPSTGVPLPWKKALKMPGAGQIQYVTRLFHSVNFSRLRPAQDILAKQPGAESPKRYVNASRTIEGDQILVYVPEDRSVELTAKALKKGAEAYWFNPRNGERTTVTGKPSDKTVEFATPDAGDWLLVVKNP